MNPVEKLSDDLLHPVAEFMHASAQKHAAHSGGLLIALEPDTTTYEHQSLLHPVVNSKDELASVESITPIASAIRPTYPKLLQAIATIDNELPQDEQAMTLVGEVLESGQNVVFGYDHSEDVITFIMSGLAATNALRERGYSFRPAVMASKMIDYLAIDLEKFGSFRPHVEQLLADADVQIEPNGLVHARHILSRAFSKQYLTIPNSQTTEEFRRRNQLVVEAYNRYVRSQISEDMKPSRFTKQKPPILMHAATPGSLNYMLDVKKFHMTKRRGIYDFESLHNPDEFEEGQVEVIGGAADGLISIFKRALTYAVVSKMHHTPPFFVIDKAHIALTDSHAVRELGKKQVRLLDAVEPEVMHVYDAKRSLPLVRD